MNLYTVIPIRRRTIGEHKAGREYAPRFDLAPMNHREQFEFYTFAELLGCVRGKFFAGYASELL